MSDAANLIADVRAGFALSEYGESVEEMREGARLLDAAFAEITRLAADAGRATKLAAALAFWLTDEMHEPGLIESMVESHRRLLADAGEADREATT